MLHVLVLGAFAPFARSPLQQHRIATCSLQRSRPVAATLDAEPHARLILVRHGQSEWNRANRFTGWVDVDLTEQGIAEAREAGRLLGAEGLLVDEVHTSFLRRAIRSSVLMLSTLNQCWVPVTKHPRLNEQHSGMLTGQNKRELAQEYGVDQVMAWRRKYDEPPPDAVGRLQKMIQADDRYKRVPEGGVGEIIEVPQAESLAMVCERLDPLWKETILPSLRAGRTVMVVSHGNTVRATSDESRLASLRPLPSATLARHSPQRLLVLLLLRRSPLLQLRALVKRIDGVNEEGAYFLDLPTATPLVYEFDAAMEHLQPHGVWGDGPRAPVRHGRYLIEEG